MNASDMDARRTFYRFALGAAFLLATHLTGASSSTGMTILVVGVAVLGLPHGAFDHLLGQRILRGGLLKRYGSHPLLALSLFLLLYVSLSLALMAGWIAAPAPGLWLFLLISACHFGTDWRGVLPLAPRLAWGCAIMEMHALPQGEVPVDGVRALPPGGEAWHEGAGVITVDQGFSDLHPAKHKPCLHRVEAVDFPRGDHVQSLIVGAGRKCDKQQRDQ